MIAVLVADDHEIVRRGLRLTIQAEPDLTLVGEARDGLEAVEMALRLHPQVVLMDLKMPGLDGVQAVARIHASMPDIAVLMLTSYAGDDQIYAALQAGASGYLLKDMSGDDLLAALRGAAAGEPQLHPHITRRLMQSMARPVDPLAELTARETDILRLLANGLSNKEIGLRLSLSEATVKGYVSTVLDKLGVEDRTQAALLAVRRGLVKLDD